jgi:D-alanine-D-alanine ligase
MQIPYTGCTSEALAATASKLAVKQQLVRAGLPTPSWVTEDGRYHSADQNPRLRPSGNQRFILKSVLEHSSFEVGDDSIKDASDLASLKRAIRRCEAKTGRPFFAEEFIEGREFNLSVLGQRPMVLPPAEIDFSELPTGKPHIVSRDAKCDASTFEFHHTPRRFDFPHSDRVLLNRLRRLTAGAAELFNVRGYARVDFRCDESGQPWILEVNSNPCVSPNAGFMAAMERAGFSFDDALARLLDDAMSRGASKSPRAHKRRSRVTPRIASDATAANL